MATTDTNVPQVIVNKLTQAQYDTAVKDPTEFYAVTDGQIETADIANNAVTANKASFTTYSTTEQVVGTWIDGKPIYRIVVNFGALPNATTKRVSHGISNLDRFVKIEGITVSSGNYAPIPLMYSSTEAQYNTAIFVNDTEVAMTSSQNRENISAYIFLDYTKSTD